MSASFAPGKGVEQYNPRVKQRQNASVVMKWFLFGATALAIVLLGMLLYSIVAPGLPWLKWHLITNMPSRIPERAGMNSAIWGSIWIVLGAAVISFLLVLGTSIYLDDYAEKNRSTCRIQTNFSDLTGVLSSLFGLLWLVACGDCRLLGHSLLAWVLSMGRLILPVGAIALREA